MPLPRYGLRDSLILDIERLSVQFKFTRFDIFRVICDVLEGDGRVMEAIECFQQMQRELGEETSIDNERAQWELSERYRDQCNQGLTKHGTQVFSGDVQTGWRSSATPRWILGGTMKLPNTSRLYCRSTRWTGWISSSSGVKHECL